MSANVQALLNEPEEARDPHRFSTELDEETLDRLVQRLESRGRDAVFTRLFQRYAERLDLPAEARVLEIGCGTGVVSRALVQREGFTGSVTGVDQCPVFIDNARRFARADCPGASLSFLVGDVHSLEFPDRGYDAVIAHTLISHVTDPRQVVAEMHRVTRTGGTVAIFDGDYASLTYALADEAFGRRMDRALATATFNNRLVMRALPEMLPALGLEIREILAEVVAEVGTASYFKSFADTYAPLVAKAGLLSSEKVSWWLEEQRRAMAQGTFFASCNYYAYLARARR